MRPIIFFLALAGLGIIAWLIAARPGKQASPTKTEAIAVSKHSKFFNDQISAVLNDYNKITENFVNWDSTTASATATTMTSDFNNIKLDELKNDSTIYLTAETFLENAKGDLQTIAGEKNIKPQREAFNSLTDNLYQFLNTVKYDKEKLYLQECPMAVEDIGKPGQWLSQQEEIRNPYMGLHHPTYGKAMLTCGETKITLNHSGIQ